MEYKNVCETEQDILALVNQNYAVHGESIRLHRAGAGRVYYINCPNDRKVLKLCRPVHRDEAIQATYIISYLDRCGFPVVKIIPSLIGSLHITTPMPDGEWTAILFEFAKGRDIGFLHRWRDNKQPLVHPKAKELARQVGIMHRLMDSYPGELIPKGREQYIDEFIAAMRRGGHDEVKIRDMEEYGNELWSAVEKLPQGFCHGDMHPGNTAYHGGTFTWMDFDRASFSHPAIDVGWLTDGTDFNVFDNGALDRSRELFDEILAGYSMERTLTQGEISALFGCTALIHFDLFSSFVASKNGIISKEQVDEQHGWLMGWRELCEKMK